MGNPGKLNLVECGPQLREHCGHAADDDPVTKVEDLLGAKTTPPDSILNKGIMMTTLSRGYSDRKGRLATAEHKCTACKIVCAQRSGTVDMTLLIKNRISFRCGADPSPEAERGLG